MPPAPPHSYTEMDPSRRQFCYFASIYILGRMLRAPPGWPTMDRHRLRFQLWDGLHLKIREFHPSSGVFPFCKYYLVIIYMNSFKHTATGSVIFLKTNAGSNSILIKNTEMWPDLMFLTVPWQLLRDSAGCMEMHKHSPSHYFCLERLRLHEKPSTFCLKY